MHVNVMINVIFLLVSCSGVDLAEQLRLVGLSEGSGTVQDIKDIFSIVVPHCQAIYLPMEVLGNALFHTKLNISLLSRLK